MSEIRRDPRACQRILVLTADFLPGNWSGIGVAVEAQARALVSQGHHVEVLWASPRLPLLVPRERAGVRVHAQGAARCAVDPSEFQLFHLHSLALTELALEMAQRFATPLVYTCHALVERELPFGAQRTFWTRVQRELFVRADGVVFLNARDRELACAESPGLAPRSWVVFNGLDLTGGTMPTLARRRDTLLFAGRFAKSKGILLLEALADRLLGARDLRLVVAGGHGDGVGEAAVAGLQRRHGSRCEVLPWQTPEQLRALYLTASLTLMPSEYEPFGLVALEALACGCPVLARDVGGLAALVEPDFGNGLLRTDEPEEWARAVLESLQVSAARSGLPEHVSQAIRMRFSSERCAVDLSGVYSQLLRDRAARGQPGWSPSADHRFVGRTHASLPPS